MTTKLQPEDSRYPYTYACDLVRTYGGYGERGIVLSRSQASQIRELFAQVLNIDDSELAKKLADYYLLHKDELTDRGVREFMETMKWNDAVESRKG